MNIIYKSPFDNQCKVVSADSKKIPIEELKRLILLKEELSHMNPYINFHIFFNGKKITDDLYMNDFNVFIQIAIPLHGGKGGFGSMLRAIGAQIEKTTNREACRDLSGRRLRDVNEEKRIKEWIKKQAQRKEEEKKKKEKLKNIAEGNILANCKYEDTEFEKFRTEIPDIVEESISAGLQQQSSSKQTDLKRKLTEDASKKDSISDNELNNEEPEPPTKKMAKKKPDLWLGIDADSDSGTSSDEDLESKKKLTS